MSFYVSNIRIYSFNYDLDDENTEYSTEDSEDSEDVDSTTLSKAGKRASKEGETSTKKGKTLNHLIVKVES